MARATIAAQDITGSAINWSQTGTLLSFTAANVTDKNKSPATGRTILIAWNSGASTRNIVVTSSADASKARTGNATRALAAGAMAMFSLVRDGWEQTDDAALPDTQWFYEADHADVKFAVLTLVN